MVLFAVSAGKDLALGGKRDEVVDSGGDLDYRVGAEVRECDGLKLGKRRAFLAVEAEESFRGLRSRTATSASLILP